MSVLDPARVPDWAWQAVVGEGWPAQRSTLAAVAEQHSMAAQAHDAAADSTEALLPRLQSSTQGTAGQSAYRNAQQQIQQNRSLAAAHRSLQQKSQQLLDDANLAKSFILLAVVVFFVQFLWSSTMLLVPMLAPVAAAETVEAEAEARGVVATVLRWLLARVQARAAVEAAEQASVRWMVTGALKSTAFGALQAGGLEEGADLLTHRQSDLRQLLASMVYGGVQGLVGHVVGLIVAPLSTRLATGLTTRAMTDSVSDKLIRGATLAAGTGVTALAAGGASVAAGAEVSGSPVTWKDVALGSLGPLVGSAGHIFGAGWHGLTDGSAVTVGISPQQARAMIDRIRVPTTDDDVEMPGDTEISAAAKWHGPVVDGDGASLPHPGEFGPVALDKTQVHAWGAGMAGAYETLDDRMGALSGDTVRRVLHEGSTQQRWLAAVEAYRRATVDAGRPDGIVARGDQIAGALAMFDRPVKMAAGQGKTTMFALHLLMRVSHGETVQFVTSAVHLANREYQLYTRVIAGVGDQVFRVRPDVNAPRSGSGRGALHVGTIGELAEAVTKLHRVPGRVVVVDEIDMLEWGIQAISLAKGTGKPASPEMAAYLHAIQGLYDHLTDNHVLGDVDVIPGDMDKPEPEFTGLTDEGKAKVVKEIDAWFSDPEQRAMRAAAAPHLKAAAKQSGREFEGEDLHRFMSHVRFVRDYLPRIDDGFIVRNGRLRLINEATNELLADEETGTTTRWGQGIAQAAEATLGIPVHNDPEFVRTMLITQLFSRDFYDVVTGASGTPDGAVHITTGAFDMPEPMEIDRPTPSRLDIRYVGARNHTDKLTKLADDIADEYHSTRQLPQLIGAVRNSDARRLADLLFARYPDIPRGAVIVVDATTQDEMGAGFQQYWEKVLADAGKRGKILIAGIAGRGADIAIAAEVEADGGLVTRGTEMSHLSEDLITQLCARSGRTGPVYATRPDGTIETRIGTQRGTAVMYFDLEDRRFAHADADTRLAVIHTITEDEERRRTGVGVFTARHRNDRPPPITRMSLTDHPTYDPALVSARARNHRSFLGGAADHSPAPHTDRPQQFADRRIPARRPTHAPVRHSSAHSPNQPTSATPSAPPAHNGPSPVVPTPTPESAPDPAPPVRVSPVDNPAPSPVTANAAANTAAVATVAIAPDTPSMPQAFPEPSPATAEYHRQRAAVVDNACDRHGVVEPNERAAVADAHDIVVHRIAPIFYTAAMALLETVHRITEALRTRTDTAKADRDKQNDHSNVAVLFVGAGGQALARAVQLCDPEFHRRRSRIVGVSAPVTTDILRGIAPDTTLVLAGDNTDTARQAVQALDATMTVHAIPVTGNLTTAAATLATLIANVAPEHGSVEGAIADTSTTAFDNTMASLHRENNPSTIPTPWFRLRDRQIAPTTPWSHSTRNRSTPGHSITAPRTAEKVVFDPDGQDCGPVGARMRQELTADRVEQQQSGTGPTTGRSLEQECNARLHLVTGSEPVARLRAMFDVDPELDHLVAVINRHRVDMSRFGETVVVFDPAAHLNRDRRSRVDVADKHERLPLSMEFDQWQQQRTKGRSAGVRVIGLRSDGSPIDASKHRYLQVRADDDEILERVITGIEPADDTPKSTGKRFVSPRFTGRVRRMLLSHAISSAANSAIGSAIAVLVFAITHSGLFTGLATAAAILPGMLFSQLAGKAADKRDRKRVVMTGQTAGLLSILVTGLLTVAAVPLIGAILILGCFIEGTAAVFTNSATKLMMRDMVAPKNVGKLFEGDEARYQAGVMFGGFVGPWLAGLASWSPFAMRVLAYLQFITAVRAVDDQPAQGQHAETHATVENGSEHGTDGDRRQKMAEVWRYILAEPVLRADAITGLFRYVAFAVLPLRIIIALHSDPGWVIGLVRASGGVGGVLGALVLAGLLSKYGAESTSAPRGSNIKLVYALTTIAVAASAVLSAATDSPLWLAVAYFIESIVGGAQFVRFMTHAAQVAPKHLLGRLQGALDTLYSTGLVLGYVGGGWVLSRAGGVGVAGWGAAAIWGGVSLVVPVVMLWRRRWIPRLRWAGFRRHPGISPANAEPLPGRDPDSPTAAGSEPPTQRFREVAGTRWALDDIRVEGVGGVIGVGETRTGTVMSSLRIDRLVIDPNDPDTGSDFAGFGLLPPTAEVAAANRMAHMTFEQLSCRTELLVFQVTGVDSTDWGVGIFADTRDVHDIPDEVVVQRTKAWHDSAVVGWVYAPSSYELAQRMVDAFAGRSAPGPMGETVYKALADRGWTSDQCDMAALLSSAAVRSGLLIDSTVSDNMTGLAHLVETGSTFAMDVHVEDVESLGLAHPVPEGTVSFCDYMEKMRAANDDVSASELLRHLMVYGFDTWEEFRAHEPDDRTLSGYLEGFLTWSGIDPSRFEAAWGRPLSRKESAPSDYSPSPAVWRASPFLVSMVIRFIDAGVAVSDEAIRVLAATDPTDLYLAFSYAVAAQWAGPAIRNGFTYKWHPVKPAVPTPGDSDGMAADSLEPDTIDARLLERVIARLTTMRASHREIYVDAATAAAVYRDLRQLVGTQLPREEHESLALFGMHTLYRTGYGWRVYKKITFDMQRQSWLQSGDRFRRWTPWDIERAMGRAQKRLERLLPIVPCELAGEVVRLTRRLNPQALEQVCRQLPDRYARYLRLRYLDGLEPDLVAAEIDSEPVSPAEKATATGILTRPAADLASLDRNATAMAAELLLRRTTHDEFHGERGDRENTLAEMTKRWHLDPADPPDALALMPPDHKTYALQRYIQGKSRKEIEDAQGWSAWYTKRVADAVSARLSDRTRGTT